MRVEAEKKREVVIRVRDLYKVYRMGDTKVYALNGVDPPGRILCHYRPLGFWKIHTAEHAGRSGAPF